MASLIPKLSPNSPIFFNVHEREFGKPGDEARLWLHDMLALIVSVVKHVLSSPHNSRLISQAALRRGSFEVSVSYIIYSYMNSNTF